MVQKRKGYVVEWAKKNKLFLYKDNETYANVVSFSGWKMYVPPTLWSTFLEHHAMDTDLLSPMAENIHCYIGERPPEDPDAPRRFVVDLDFDGNVEISREFFEKFQLVVAKMIQLNFDSDHDKLWWVVLSSPPMDKVSQGKSYKKTAWHLVFPNLFLCRRDCLHLRNILVEFSISYLMTDGTGTPDAKDGYPTNSFHDSIDEGIYLNGLRFPGSRKADKCDCFRKKSKSQQSQSRIYGCPECSWEGFIDKGRPYHISHVYSPIEHKTENGEIIINIKDQRHPQHQLWINLYENNTPAQRLSLLTINANDVKINTHFKPLSICSPPDDSMNAAGPKKKIHTWSEIQKNDLKNILRQSRGRSGVRAVPDHLKNMAEEYIRSLHPGWKDIRVATANISRRFMFLTTHGLGNNYCAIKYERLNRQHRQTSLTDLNHEMGGHHANRVSFTLHPTSDGLGFDVRIRCFNTDCKKYVYQNFSEGKEKSGQKTCSYRISSPVNHPNYVPIATMLAQRITAMTKTTIQKQKRIEKQIVKKKEISNFDSLQKSGHLVAMFGPKPNTKKRQRKTSSSTTRKKRKLINLT